MSSESGVQIIQSLNAPRTPAAAIEVIAPVPNSFSSLRGNSNAVKISRGYIILWIYNVHLNSFFFYIFNRLDMYNMFDLWMYGNPSENIPPYRRLPGKSFEDKCFFSKVNFVCSLMERKMQRLLPSGQSIEKLSDIDFCQLRQQVYFEIMASANQCTLQEVKDTPKLSKQLCVSSIYSKLKQKNSCDSGDNSEV